MKDRVQTSKEGRKIKHFAIMLVSSLIILTLVGLASCPPPPPTKKVPQLLQKQVAPKHLPQKQKQRPLQLTISPTSVTLYPGKKVTVKCRVKGTYAITQWLDIGFYMLLKKNTVMPLSSGFPGVSIRSSATEGRRGSNQRRTITRLTLHPEMYDLLKVGDNYFCCKAILLGNSSATGHRYVDYFIVRKKPRRRNTPR